MELIKALWNIEMMKWDLLVEYWYVWVLILAVPSIFSAIKILTRK